MSPLTPGVVYMGKTMEVGVPRSTMQDHLKKDLNLSCQHSQINCQNFKLIDTVMYVVCRSTHSKIMLPAESLSTVIILQFITVPMTEILCFRRRRIDLKRVPPPYDVGWYGRNLVNWVLFL